MTINGTRRAAVIVLASCAASAAPAQVSRPTNGEFVVLDRPAVFEMNPNTGSLKESVQKGQQLVWHPKEKSNEPRFQVTNISLAFLRSESGGQVKMTFTGNVSSLGYSTPEEAKRDRSRQRRRVAALVELRPFGQMHRQGSAADASDPRRAQRTRTEHLHECEHGRNCRTGRAEFPRGEGSAMQLNGA
jgi:hypothetical protein